jgi:hypothetical protein
LKGTKHAAFSTETTKHVIDNSGECSGAYQLLQTIKSINTGELL